MEDEKLYVGKVKDSEPETLFIVGIQYGKLTRMSHGLKEADLWGKLHTMGVPDNEITSLLEGARANPTP